MSGSAHTLITDRTDGTAGVGPVLSHGQKKQSLAGENACCLECLDARIVAWVRSLGWQDLRPIQKAALGPVLAGTTDVLLSAATAAGKTEAAFLPAISRVLAEGSGGTPLLYLSPLKALINDQYRRLAPLCARLNLPLIPWHGDLSAAARHSYLETAHGILLTTPESLEGFLLRHSAFCYRAFSSLSHVIIDEFHSFAGVERGRQLVSLLHRIEALAHHTVPRIALSATLGDEEGMKEELRPHRGAYPCLVVRDDAERHPLVQLRAYLEVPPFLRERIAEHGINDLADDLFNLLVGGHHLVFANSRARTEQVATLLAQRCRQFGMENEFFPHHGSLSRDLRARLEARLQDAERPTTAVCTSTLELGIDIGNMDSVVQIDAPNSVASLSQRLGRAGRRGGQQLLRICLLENFVLRNAGLADRLHLGLFQSLAVLRLLQEGWCEPGEAPRPHYSTLVQQLLAVLGQYGAVRPSVLWNFLCKTGPFNVSQENFARLLQGLARRGLVCRREGEREISLGSRGWEIVNTQDFATAFRTATEFGLVHEGRFMGQLPMTEPLKAGQSILFAGRAWKVVSLEESQHRIELEPVSEGKPPRFVGAGRKVHDRVRMTMRILYEEGKEPAFLNQKGRVMYQKARTAYIMYGLEKSSIVVDGNRLCLFPWRGDRFCGTVAALLRLAGLEASDMAGMVDLGTISKITFSRKVETLLGKGKPCAMELTQGLQETLQEKFAPFVEPELLAEDNMARFYSLDEAWAWLERLIG